MIRLADTPVLHTARLMLRAPGAADWPRWMAFMASPRACYAGGPLTEARGWRAFGHVIGHWLLRGYGSFVVTLRGSDTAIGLAGPYHPIDWPEPEIGWALWSAASEGKGYAYEAAAAARTFAFGQLGWKTAVSYIDPANARSIALARRLGAQQDPAAAHPGDDPCLVFRHPRPEAVA
jgi:RimJ/RimL family protein N-acetyltransferase